MTWWPTYPIPTLDYQNASIKNLPRYSISVCIRASGWNMWRKPKICSHCSNLPKPLTATSKTKPPFPPSDSASSDSTSRPFLFFHTPWCPMSTATDLDRSCLPLQHTLVACSRVRRSQLPGSVWLGQGIYVCTRRRSGRLAGTFWHDVSFRGSFRCFALEIRDGCESFFSAFCGLQR